MYICMHVFYTHVMFKSWLAYLSSQTFAILRDKMFLLFPCRFENIPFLFIVIFCTTTDHNIFLLSTCNLVAIDYSFSTTTSVSGNHHSTFNLLEIVILRFWIWGGSGNVYLPVSWVILLSICSPVLSTLSNWQNLIHSQIVFHSIYVPCFLKFIFISLFLRQGLFT